MDFFKIVIKIQTNHVNLQIKKTLQKYCLFEPFRHILTLVYSLFDSYTYNITIQVTKCILNGSIENIYRLRFLLCLIFTNLSGPI